MPAKLQCDVALLSEKEVRKLWQAVCEYRQCRDDIVVVRCVEKEEIKKLNATYRHKNTPTNVLTFSYPTGDDRQSYDAGEKSEDKAEHDIAVCLDVAKVEAGERDIPLRDYFGLLIVHSFLHATGLDHERSSDEAKKMREAEQQILEACGFVSVWL